MERLRDRDLRAVVAFLRYAYVQPDLDAFASYAVDALTGVVGGQRVSYNEAHPKLGTIRAVIRPDDRYPRLNVRQYRDHPMFQRFLATGDGRAYKFSDFLTSSDLHATDMYQEHYRLVGIEYQMTVCLGTPKPFSVGFAVGRDRIDFTERDRAALDLLRPHLARAYEQASAAARMRARMALLGRAADTASAGVVLLSRDGRIEYATRRARGWLREYFGGRGRPSSAFLPAAVVDWLRRQPVWDGTDALEAALPGPLVVAREDRRLVIRMVDDPAQRALLLEERRAECRAAALAPLGLSARESEVLALVARGASNDAIAGTLGARPRTVAKHVERIHRKLGVESRAAAAARAHEVWTGG
ncbi:MAG TPA: helix-turn-helix transcriptional regulator [Candidatus Limnocylindrales bacterium]|nr:helix-turn-helix transcriptional regulator [Candidatus Limnocylindrales bacterium]